MTDTSRVLTADRARAGWAMLFVLLTASMRAAECLSFFGRFALPHAVRIAGLVCFGASVLVFELWLYLAYQHLELIAPRRWKPFWVIVGWLIPIADLIIPTQILSDVWRGYHADPLAVAKRHSVLLISWLVFLVLAGLALFGVPIAGAVAYRNSTALPPERTMHFLVNLSVVTYFAMSAISGFLLVGYLAQTRRLLRARIEAMRTTGNG